MRKIIKEKFPNILLGIYGFFFLILAFSPYNRIYWIASNLSPVIIIFFLVKNFAGYRFSNLSYLLASIFIFLQTLGSHYFFYNVHIDFITDLFQFNRNNFDRLVHFSVGLYAFLIAEYLMRRKMVNQIFIVYLFAFFAIMTVAALYEILEWIFVIVYSPGSNVDLLGAQGDIWDAQKDMLCDGIGAILSLLLFRLLNKKLLLLKE